MAMADRKWMRYVLLEVLPCRESRPPNRHSVLPEAIVHNEPPDSRGGSCTGMENGV